MLVQKNYIILLLFILVFQKNLSQEFYGEVIYTYATHFSRDFERNFKMTFDSRKSHFEEILNLTGKEIQEIDTGNGIVRSVDVYNTSGNPDLYLYDFDSFYFREHFLGEDLIVKEDMLKWNWEITEDTKMLGNFLCIKAITKFRGRTYEAWFTNNVPVSFGPWKFHGLPGLILEVREESNVLHIYASKINLSNKNNMKKVEASFYDNALTLEQYNIRKLELLRESFRKLSARLPQGSTPLVLDEDCNDCKEEIEKF